MNVAHLPMQFAVEWTETQEQLELAVHQALLAPLVAAWLLADFQVYPLNAMGRKLSCQ